MGEIVSSRGKIFSTALILLLCEFFITGPTVSAYQIATLQDDQRERGSVNSDYVLNIRKMESTITLDGVIDESDWLRADVADDFFMVTPYDTSYSHAKSEIRMTYDDDAIYLALIFYDVISAPRVVESLRRNFDPTNSNIAFLARGTDYDWVNAFVRYRSDTRKLFRYSASVGRGGFYNGNHTYLQADVN